MGRAARYSILTLCRPRPSCEAHHQSNHEAVPELVHWPEQLLLLLAGGRGNRNRRSAFWKATARISSSLTRFTLANSAATCVACAECEKHPRPSPTPAGGNRGPRLSRTKRSRGTSKATAPIESFNFECVSRPLKPTIKLGKCLSSAPAHFGRPWKPDRSTECSQPWPPSFSTKISAMRRSASSCGGSWTMSGRPNSFARETCCSATETWASSRLLS
mmetsp:Transcript_909/g.2402  ORF Transcript_909/g.2402 Transcript_909/m.2402 type:complete len:217 (-) Transcript_909:99-749(-)